MKNLTIVFCLDDGGGMTFGGRRQSRDRRLIADLMAILPENIYVNQRSALLFADCEERIRLWESEKNLPLESWCFLEFDDPSEYVKRAKRLVIYFWNRVYPRDCAYDTDALTRGFKLCSETEFCGSSHERITRRIFEK